MKGLLAMTRSEQCAYAWLVNEKGYRPEDIAFRYTATPDFLTSDGKGWETKRRVAQSISFREQQIPALRARQDTSIVVVNKAGNIEVVIPMSTLSDIPCTVGDLNLLVYSASKRQTPSPLLQEVIWRQEELGLTDIVFAQYLGVSRPLWGLTKSGDMNVGLKLLGAIYRRFPDLGPLILKSL